MQMPKLGTIANKIAEWCLYSLVFLMPIFYLPWTTNVLEVNKQLILVVLAMLGGLAWLGAMLAAKEFQIRRSFVNIIVVAYVLMVGVATLFSKNHSLSFFGYEANQYTSFLTVLAFAVFYFLVANSSRTVKSARMLFGAFLVSAFLAKVVALFALFGLNLPGGSGANFNTVGSVFSLGVFAAFDLLLISGFLLIESKEHRGLMPDGKSGMAAKLFLVASAVLSLVVLAALDYWVVWAMLIVGTLCLLGFGLAYPKDFPDMSKFVMPLLALVVALVFLVIQTPLRFNLPTEVSPSLKGSWNIAKQALRDNPMVGSGPGTYSYDYAKYHDASVNETIFWNLRFDRANSHVMTLLATMGVLGTLLYIMMIFAVLFRGAQYVMRAQEKEQRHMSLILMSAFIGLVVSKFLYASNMTLEFLFWFSLGLITIAISGAALKKSFPEAPRMSLLLSFFFVLLLVVGVGFSYLVGQHYVADYKFAKALEYDQAGKSEDAMNSLVSAAQLDTQNDSYFRNLSQAELLKINEEAGKTGKDDAEKQAIARRVVALAQAAVNSALYAKNIAPLNVANQSQLAFIYQNISPFTDGALDEALKAYEESMKLEPANPVYPTQMGRIYLAKSDEARQKSASKDEAEAKVAKDQVTEFLGKAEDKFNAAIALKSDYAPAHYNLALTYDRQGRLKDSIAKMEAVRALSPRDVGVYFQLGLLYYRDGQKDKAQQAFEAAVALSPNYSNALWYLATIYEEKGDAKKAVELVRKVAELNPDDALVKARLEKLQGGTTAKPGSALPPPIDQPKGAADLGVPKSAPKPVTP